VKTINTKLSFGEKKTQFLEEYFHRLLHIHQMFTYGAGLSDIGWPTFDSSFAYRAQLSQFGLNV
jgi:hypothetical protein